LSERRTRPWLLRAAALAALAVSLVVLTMLARHRSARPVLGPYSLPAATALALALATAGLAAAGLVLPSRSLNRLESWLAGGAAALRRPVVPGTARLGAILVALALASYLAIGFRLLAVNERPNEDEMDYLRKADEIGRAGGISELWRQLWKGSYEAGDPAAANRHPLYPAIVSFRPNFVAAKRLSLWLGLVPLAVVTWGTVRRAGWLAGGAAAVLLTTNGTFQQSAAIVACEILLIGWVVLTWFSIDRPRESSGTDPSGGCQLRRSWISTLDSQLSTLLVGVWLGLAYLTKASALFLLVGFLAWGLTVPKLRRWSWLAVVSFAVVSSPLLVRNVRGFGDPLYSYNTRFLFADSFGAGQAGDFRGVAAEAADYFRTHSVGVLARRLLSGLGWEAYIFLRSLGPAPLGTSRPLVGLIVLGLALLGTIGAERRLPLLAAIWSGGFLVFFAWYVPIASGDRFLAPIVPIVLLFAARGVVSLVGADPAASATQIGRRIIWMAVLWCVAVVALSYARSPAALERSASASAPAHAGLARGAPTRASAASVVESRHGLSDNLLCGHRERS
jgi:hypothetical protein